MGSVGAAHVASGQSAGDWSATPEHEGKVKVEYENEDVAIYPNY